MRSVNLSTCPDVLSTASGVSTVVSNSSISSSITKWRLHVFMIFACNAVAGGPRSNSPATGAYSANAGVKKRRDERRRVRGARVRGVRRGCVDISVCVCLC